VEQPAGSLQTLARLLGFLRPFAGRAALSVLIGAATVAAGIGLLGTSAFLIAAAALQPSVADLQVAIVGVRFFGISRALLRYLERLVTHDANFRLLARLRVWLYSRLEPLAPARLQGYRSADLLNRAVADIDTLENFYVRAVAPPVIALLVSGAVVAFVARSDGRMALLLGGMLALAGIGLPVLAHFMARPHGKAQVEARAELHSHLLDAVQGMPELLLYGQAVAQQEKIRRASAAQAAAQRRAGNAGALAGALGQLAAGLALWGVLMLGVPMVGWRLDGITLAVLALVTMASFEAVTPLTQAAQHLETSLQAARRLFALAEPQPGAPLAVFASPSAARPEPSLAGPVHLRVRGLHFAYAPGLPLALEDFSLDLAPGKRVALVGASGAGKSTLFRLLLRFWEAPSGSITINGTDIHQLDPENVRAGIALVPQSVYVFAGTLRQNILLARPGASDADVERAVVEAGLNGLVARLPGGLDAWVGERGAQFSGGERQRVAVARALLRRAPLLLVDEPTAHLDALNERALLEVLLRAAQDRSVLIITHRLVCMERMDEIIVLHAGRVVERGTHNALLGSGGYYAQMWRMQAEMLV
jgi:thiol reductant ABC exporter CydC subunit